jgi:hypothetical protein
MDAIRCKCVLAIQLSVPEFVSVRAGQGKNSVLIGKK